MTQQFEHPHHRPEAHGHTEHTGHIEGSRFHHQFHSLSHHDVSASFRRESAHHSREMERTGMLPGLHIHDHKHHGEEQTAWMPNHPHHLKHHGHVSEHHHLSHHSNHHVEHHGAGGEHHLRHHGYGHHNTVEQHGHETRRRGGDEIEHGNGPSRGGNEVANDGSNMTKNEKEKYLFQRLTDKNGLGLTDKQAAGAIGSLEGESPNLYSGRVDHKHEHDLGFVNWIGSRRKELEHFARGQGKDPTDFKTQVDFMEKELKGSENKALRMLKHTHSVPAATRVFTSEYERPSIPHMNHRIKNGEVAYENMHKWHDSRNPTDPDVDVA